jgi:hypothetical protein
MTTAVVTLRGDGVTLNEIMDLLKQFPFSGVPVVLNVCQLFHHIDKLLIVLVTNHFRKPS